MDPDKQATLARLNEAFGLGVPHNAALGLRMVDYADGEARIVLPYDAKLIGNPETRVLHGGAVTGLLDATCGAAVFMKLCEPLRIATLDLRIDYLRPAVPDHDLIAHATCYKVTRHIAFVRALAHHGDPDDAVASAVGTFAIFRDGKTRLAREMTT